MRRRITCFGEEILRNESFEVKEITDEIKNLVEDMFETMEDADGVGLAAPQVNVAKRVIVIDVPPLSEEESRVREALINPVILSKSEETQIDEEGCLSVPGVRAEVERALSVEVEYLSLDGEKKRIKGDRLLARALQHEIDHLNGVLFVNLLSDDVRKEIRNELKEIKRNNRAKLKRSR